MGLLFSKSKVFEGRSALTLTICTIDGKRTSYHLCFLYTSSIGVFDFNVNVTDV